MNIDSETGDDEMQVKINICSIIVIIFRVQYCKTKTKVINLANHNRCRQSNEKRKYIKTVPSTAKHV